MNLKVFFASLILSLPFWWGINNLDKNLNVFFYAKEIADNPQIYAAGIVQVRHAAQAPIRDESVPDFQIEAESALSVFIDNDGKEKILFENNPNDKLPIASLSKLMTALIVIENYNLEKKITVSKEAVDQEEYLGQLQAGKIFPVKYLLYPLLMESSNDAAFSLAEDYEGMDLVSFVNLMNLNAQRLNLNDTSFVSPSGLDPEKDEPQEKINLSTVSDLTKLAKYLLKEPVIWEILSLKKYSAFGPELINGNALLGEIPDVLGGKTGYTEKAGKCMVLVLKAPNNKGYIINAILGTNDKFGEMKKLVEWVNNAYKF